MSRSIILLGVLLLSACAAPPPRVVEVDKAVVVASPPQYVPVPPSLFAGCTSPAPAGPTNGDLLLHNHAEMAYATCLEGELAAIKALK